MYGLKRLRKKRNFMGSIQKNISQGLKPNPFCWPYRHD
jgi:hypothetical protein